ncbi:MAG: RNAse Z [Bacteroidia bacterium]|nr:RNAse Z [Bacteroidia bacterium]
MQLNLSGYSTAMFSTWYFVEELGILFDAGDGIVSSLMQKSRKINHVFISHADRDHLTGLFQFNQLNARAGFPVLHYPKDCGSFPPLENFTKQFDAHVAGTVWKKLEDKEKIYLREDLYVQAIRNNHVAAEKGIHKSFGYKVVSVKKKLKPEYSVLSPAQIKEVIVNKGKEATLMDVETILLAYSGDTPVENFEQWNGAETLIHEATFLGGPEDANIKTHGNKHSQLNDVIKAVSQIELGKLVLGHFSSRYSHQQIDEAIKKACEEYAIKIPVYRVLPGETVKNILTTNSLNGF